MRPALGPLCALAATAVLTCTSLTTTGCQTERGPVAVVTTDAGEVRIAVELALTRAEQARGLMWRTDLPADAGMLFVFAADRERSFWMKNTPLPLDIFFIDGGGVIGHIAEHTTPYSEQPVPSEGPARYVLEVNAGFARGHGIRPGQQVRLPDLPAAGGEQGRPTG